MPAHSTDSPEPASSRVARVLPYLRRHARALTGAQDAGDRYAVATMEALLQERPDLGESDRPDLAVFRAFYRIWQSTGEKLEAEAPGDGPRARALEHLAQLTPRSREALLLHTVEGFSLQDVATIMGVTPEEAGRLVEVARGEMHASVRGRVMVIEDESIIAMDIESILADMGHAVTGIAATRDEAVRLGRQAPPDLILADIQLADDSSGVDAVNELLAEFPDTPVIFVTAFPERLLTGARPEPSFLIAKPFQPAQVISAVSQAMFFASTETLRA